MKKLVSKITVTALAMLMVLSCAVTAFAATTEVTETKGSISLTQYDISTVTKDDEGNIISGEKVGGVTFSAYRILDFDGSTYTVNEDFTGQLEITDIVNTSASQKGTLGYGSTEELEAKIPTLQSYIRTQGIDATAEKTTDDEGSAVLSGLDLGVYLVQETGVPEGYTITAQAFLVAIPFWEQTADSGNGSWIYDIVVYPKSEVLEVDKQITDGEQSTDADSYAIGEVIPYTVTAVIPDYGKSASYPELTVTENLLLHDTEGKGVVKFNALNLIFTDTLSEGLTLDPDSLEIKIYDKDGTTLLKTLSGGESLAVLESIGTNDIDKITEQNTANGGDYTVSTGTDEDGNMAMTVTVAWNSLDNLLNSAENYQGKIIRLTYNARLNEKAVVGDANTNTVEYSFCNNPQYTTGEAEDPPRTITIDETEVYTYEMELTKTFNGKKTPEEGNASGVEFELYRKGDSGSEKLNVIKNSDGNYTVWNGSIEEMNGVLKAFETFGTTEKIYLDGVVTTALSPDESGSLKVKGLGAGVYELKEIKSVSGYTVLTEPVTILVEEVIDSSTGKVTAAVSAYTLKYQETAEDGSTVTEKKDNLTSDTEKAAKGIFTITVNNAKNQFSLPQTGEWGLWMFPVAGGILLAAAIILFYMLRRRKVRN